MISLSAFPLAAGCMLLVSAGAFARNPANIDEALKCVFFAATFGADEKPIAHGSAFVVEEDGVQWIHTNAHVIEGAAKIQFTDMEGKVLAGFGRFGCYAEGSGTMTIAKTSKKGKDRLIQFGGDGVRLELKRPREFAFKLHKDPASVGKGYKVITLGDNDGDKKMETLPGDVVSATERAVLTSCKTTHGSSGGVLLDAKDFTAIGLNTWGIEGVKPLETLWQEDRKQAAGGLAGATLLQRATWAQVPAADFLKGSEQMQKFLDTVRVLTIIYNTTPTKSGFAVKLSDRFAGPVTYKLALDRYRRHSILGPVAQLNEKLARVEGTSIGVNNMEVVKTYSRAIQEIRQDYLKESQEILRKTPPYYRIELEKLGVIALGEGCHKNLQNAEDWFNNKASLGGTMPVGTWFTLPPLSQFGPAGQ
ncbi:serine protease [Luteolibacter arcticus]|uniref:Serine protease n=1 Tax=Luteolibacter arcticus TaxID=1581411 RepID=A0ABT3GIA1_9BACT|nr:serine protease [Luteolibacter arcticus]MCW1923233.1 serine protease [Luteolibacter arcticus]